MPRMVVVIHDQLCQKETSYHIFQKKLRLLRDLILVSLLNQH